MSVMLLVVRKVIKDKEILCSEVKASFTSQPTSLLLTLSFLIFDGLIAAFLFVVN